MKYLLIPIALLFIGCGDDTSAEYKKFTATYGADSRIYCDESGFLVREWMFSHYKVPSREVVTNDSDTPTRCNVKDISIRVKETVATGAMSGDVR